MVKIILKAFVGILVFAVLLNFETKAQKVDFLKVPGPVKFHGSDFQLAWTSHPNDTYYKQEYVRAGEKVESYKEMILLEFLVGEFSAKDLIDKKVLELNNRKKTDPVVNYGIMNSPDGKEFILDFILSSGPAENLEIVEWNAYRYKTATDATGKKGVVLLGISRRAYGKEITAFLKDLKTSSSGYRNALISYKIPEVNTGK